MTTLKKQKIMKKLNSLKIVRTMVLKLLFGFLLISSFLVARAQATKEVLFEGYFKININKQHLGYLISKYEFDPISKRFFATIFTKTGALGDNITESVKAVSDANLAPINYEYLSLSSERGKTTSKKIEATFRFKKETTKKKLPSSKNPAKNKLTLFATVIQDGKMSKLETDLPEDTFLSYFLAYLMLKSKTGIQTNSNYEYKAIAEEKAKLTSGISFVKAIEDFNGYKAYRIENEFDSQNFISYLTDRGELLGVINPKLGIETELMAKPNEAVGTFPFPTAILKTLFGEVPLGTNNIVSKTLKKEALRAVTQPPGSKQFGTPEGTEIVSKPGGSNNKFDNKHDSQQTDASDQELPMKVETLEKKIPLEK